MRWIVRLLILLLSTSAFSQSYYRMDFFLQNAQGQAIPGATVTVYNQTSCGGTRSSLATIYASASGGTPISGSVVTTDGFGHTYAYSVAGCYTIVYYSPYTGTQTYADQSPTAGGSGVYLPLNGGTLTGELTVPDIASTSPGQGSLGTSTNWFNGLYFGRSTSYYTLLEGPTTQSGNATLISPLATGSDTLVTLAAAQDLTNKTLASPTLVSPALGIPSSGVITNLSGTCASCNIGGNAATASTATSATTAAGLSGTPSISIANLNGNGTVTLTGIEALSTTSCLQINTSGVVSNTGSACGTGTSSISGMAAGQVAIAATASTIASSKVLAGSGSGITTGPTSVTASRNLAIFTGTGGQLADSGGLANLDTSGDLTVSGNISAGSGGVITASEFDATTSVIDSGLAGAAGFVTNNSAGLLGTTTTIPVGSVSGAAPLASPAFSGTATAPTFNATSGFTVGGTALAASDLSNGTTGGGAVVLASAPTFTAAPTGVTVFHPLSFADMSGTAYTSSQVVVRYVSPTAQRVPGSGTATVGGVTCTSYFKLAAAATSSTTFIIADNGTSFGTVDFAASGTTGSLTLSISQSVAAGDVITITGPSTADSTAASLYGSLCSSY